MDRSFLYPLPIFPLRTCNGQIIIGVRSTVPHVTLNLDFATAGIAGKRAAIIIRFASK